MTENVAVGTEVRITTDKWDGYFFGPDSGTIVEVVTANYTGADETAVRTPEGEVYYVKEGEFELVSPEYPAASFSAGDQVKILGGEEPDAIGMTGIVMDLEDDRLFLPRLLGGDPPADLNIVDLPDLGAFIGLRNHEIELIEEEFTPVVPQPDFAPGTHVRVIDNSAAAVEIGDEGIVVDRDTDPRVDPFVGAFAPQHLVFVAFPGQFNLDGEELVQVFDSERLERVSGSVTDTVAGLDSDPEEAPVGTHVIVSTDIFKPYVTGDRGVVVKLGAYHVVEMYDGQELYLDRSEFVVSEDPSGILAEWEKELIGGLDNIPAPAVEEAPASVLKRDEFVAFELQGLSHGADASIRILNIDNRYFHLETIKGDTRVAPWVNAAALRSLGQALIEAADINDAAE